MDGTSRAFSEPLPLFLCGKELAGSCPKAASPGQPDWTQTRGFGRRSAQPPCGQVHGGPGSALREGRGLGAKRKGPLMVMPKQPRRQTCPPGRP